MRRFFVVLFLSAPLLFLAVAQTAPVAPQADKPKPGASGKKPKISAEQVAMEKSHALAQLEALFAKAGDFQDKKLKIKVQAQVADLLWNFDEPRARKFFVEAFEATRAVEENSQNEGGRPYEQRAELRREVLQMVARHDNKLCQSLVQSIEKDAGEAKAGTATPYANQQVRLAINIAETNPEMAAELLSSSIKGGISYDFSTALLRVFRQDAVLANKVFLQAMAANRSTGYESMWALTAYLGSANKIQASQANDPATNRMLTDINRTFWGTFGPAILAYLDEARQSGKSRPWGLQALLPFLERDASDLVGDLRARIPEPEPRTAAFENPGDQTKTQDLLAQVSTTKTEEEKDRIYDQAATVRSRSGDIEGAFSLAGNIRDVSRRDLCKRLIRSEAFRQALNKEDLDSAYRYANEETSAWRVGNFAQMIQYSIKKKNTQRAVDLVNEIESWVNRDTDYSRDPHTWLLLTGAIVPIDIERAFQLLRAAVKGMNESKFTVLEEKSSVNREKVLPLRVDNVSYKPSFFLLAQTDYFRALSIAQSIEKKEASVMAQLAVCDGVLNRPGTPIVPKKGTKPVEKGL